MDKYERDYSCSFFETTYQTKFRRRKVLEITNSTKHDNILEIGCGLVNILAARNRESGNLEIGVPVLGNRLFCMKMST